MKDSPLETGIELNVQFNDQGLAPAIVQEAETGQVLMMAWMNEYALQHTIHSGKATFYSRYRDKTWVKGESSGHVQQVLELRVDCDQDVILLRVRSHGPACHVGYPSCFYRAYDAHSQSLQFVESPAFDPEEVYGG